MELSSRRSTGIAELAENPHRGLDTSTESSGQGCHLLLCCGAMRKAMHGDGHSRSWGRIYPTGALLGTSLAVTH